MIAMRTSILTIGTFAFAVATGSSAVARDWYDQDRDRGTQRQFAPSPNARPTDNRQRRDNDNYTRGAPKNWKDQTMQDWSVHYNEQHPFVGPD
jgi:hypothetical protein